MADKFRIKLPEVYKVGDVIEVRTLAAHVMETGNRRNPDGGLIPRNIIHTFAATIDGRPVFKADFGTGIAANPYLAFEMRVPGPGVLTVTWIDDSGATIAESTILRPS